MSLRQAGLGMLYLRGESGGYVIRDLGFGDKLQLVDPTI